MGLEYVRVPKVGETSGFVNPHRTEEQIYNLNTAVNNIAEIDAIIRAVIENSSDENTIIEVLENLYSQVGQILSDTTTLLSGVSEYLSRSTTEQFNEKSKNSDTQQRLSEEEIV